MIILTNIYLGLSIIWLVVGLYLFTVKQKLNAFWMFLTIVNLIFALWVHQIPK